MCLVLLVIFIFRKLLVIGDEIVREIQTFSHGVNILNGGAVSREKCRETRKINLYEKKGRIIHPFH